MSFMMKPERARAGNLCVSESMRCLRQPLVSRRIQFFSPPLAQSNTRARTPRSSRRKLWPAGYLLVMLHQQLFDKHSSSPCANSLIYILPLRRANVMVFGILLKAFPWQRVGRRRGPRSWRTSQKLHSSAENCIKNPSRTKTGEEHSKC